uniref:Uncharacterized protein n=1 Tax=Parascaris univalens TaxID=6257 RepID=A0A915BBK6_PARUN
MSDGWLSSKIGAVCRMILHRAMRYFWNLRDHRLLLGIINQSQYCTKRNGRGSCGSNFFLLFVFHTFPLKKTWYRNFRPMSHKNSASTGQIKKFRWGTPLLRAENCTYCCLPPIQIDN